MNLRTVTIWTTAVMMIGTSVVPWLLCVFHPPLLWDYQILIVWSISGLPLVISLLYAIILRYHVSSIILLIITIAYSILYVCTLPTAFGAYLGPFALVVLGVLSLPVMTPAWIAAWLLDWHYVVKTPHPGTAASTVVYPKET